MTACPKCHADGLLWVLSESTRDPIALIHPDPDPSGDVLLAEMWGMWLRVDPDRAPDTVTRFRRHVCGETVIAVGEQGVLV